jgi:tripartite-type tricarboxylate transporter receptor subunit TctC
MKQTLCLFSRRRAALALVCTLAAGAAAAQVQVPEGLVRIVVPTTPGSTPDILARAIAAKLGERLGRTVVVDNRVGASGSIGTEAVVRAAPNGATLLLHASSLATGAKLQTLPYDAVRDLSPITLMGWTRMVLVTHPNTGFKTATDLVAAARKAPGKLNYGSPGNGTPNHLTAELFKIKTGTFITHIPYRGSGPQLTDILAGQIDLAPLTVIAAAPHVRAGKLVALAMTGDKRSALLPGVPSLSELNIAGVSGDIWYGLFGPRGLPQDLVAKLNAEVREILRGDTAALAAQGLEIESSTPEDFQQLLIRDTSRWAEVVKTQGIKSD